MIERLAYLGLAATDPEEVADFYAETLDLPRTDPESTPIEPVPAVAFDVGGEYLAIRSLRSIPSGGVHTHFAIAVSTEWYDALFDRLSDLGQVTERRFGENRSLYWFDPAGHCVEFGERTYLEGSHGGIFEVVLEVSDLDEATARYERLGFTTVDQGDERVRRRLRGAFDLELWEPQLGIGDGRGGAHVELGLYSDDPAADASIVTDRDIGAPETTPWLCVRDPDNHHLCFANVS